MQVLIAKVAVSAAILRIDKLFDYKVPSGAEELVTVGRRVAVPFGKGNKKAEGFVLALEYADVSLCERLKSIDHIYDDVISLSDEDIAIAGFLKNHYYCTFFEAANTLLPPGIWGKNAYTYYKGDRSVDEALKIVGRSPMKAAIIELIYSADKPLSLSDIVKSIGDEKAENHLKQLVSHGVVLCEQKLAKGAADKYILMASPNMTFEEAEALMPEGKLGTRRKEVYKRLCMEGEIPEKELCYLTGASSALIANLQKAGFVTLTRQPAYRRPEIRSEKEAKSVELNAHQKKAYEEIEALLDGTPRAALLYGVTGSGKTEIYIKLITELLKQGKTAILMVPEIALTPQTVRRFYSYFGNDVAIVHSALTTAQRYDEYKRIKKGEARIVVGTRTAVFAPLKNIGAIIIDEEQEYTYKSENTPRYSAEDVAKFRAIKHNCLVMLGSATPSVSTRYAAETGKISLVRLDTRYNDLPLPKTIISDMRGKLKSGAPECIGNELAEEIKINLERKEKTILFLNRRGSSNRVVCIDCGHTPTCKNCNVSLVHHSKNMRLLCHHCGYSEPLPGICSECGSTHLKFEGIGTQKVEDELKSLFPSAKTVRMDADTIVGRMSHEKLLDDFGLGDADILLGTQMVAKGLDFDSVTLVGVIDSDGFLSSNDFRAQERAFSLITQVVGRAGRRDKPGRAVIQTYTPKNPVIVSAAKQDYDSFYEYEIVTRRALCVPPFCDIFTFTVSGESEDYTLKAALSVSATLIKAFKETGDNIQVLGPIPAAISKLNGKYRFNISFRGKNDVKTRAFISRILSSYSTTSYSRSTTVSADVNTYN